MGKTFNLVLRGKCSTDATVWMAWLDTIDQSALSFGLRLTHLGVSGEGFTSGKALTYVRAANRVRKSLAFGQLVSGIGGFAMPEHYDTVAFDYDGYMARSSEHEFTLISVVGPAGALLVSEEARWRNLLEKYCLAEEGEIYTMEQCESSAFYASGATPRESYRSLEVLRRF